MTRAFWRPRLALIAATFSALPFGACQQEPGFECGRLVPGTSTVRRCDRALEVCVCATNSCARRVGFTEAEQGTLADGQGGYAGEATVAKAWGDCRGPGETGYRYAEAPYARDDLAGNCVPEVALRLGDIVPSEKTPGPGCPGQFELPAGGTSTGGSGGAGGSNPSGGGGFAAGGNAAGGGAGGEAGLHEGGSAGMSLGGFGAMSGSGEGAAAGASGANTSGSGGAP